MRSPKTVLGAIRTRYDNGWRDWLITPPSGRISFPLGTPDAKTIARNSDSVSAWLRSWRTWAGDHPEAKLRSASIASAIGSQKVFTHLELPTIEALAGLATDTQAHWQKAAQRYPQLRELNPSPDKVKPFLTQIVSLDDYDFALLLRAAGWFIGHPRSGLTLRQVPVIGMHTKWLARHRRLVLALLPTTTPETEAMRFTDDELEPEDLDLLGLKPLPNHVDVILSDPRDRSRLHGLRHLRAPLDEIAVLPLTPQRVLVVENKESALPIGDNEGLVVVHSLGNFLDVLSALPWLTGVEVWYWGDLDRAGFTLLSRARTRIPNLRSILMDPATLEDHLALAVDDNTSRVDPPDSTLTAVESAALEALFDVAPPRRLEQERLPWPVVAEALAAALGAND